VKLRARSNWKPATVKTEHYIQYDRVSRPVVGQWPHLEWGDEVVETLTVGPISDLSIERRVIEILSRDDVVVGSVQVLEKRVKGEWKARSREQQIHAA
jgi:hypothetical protein